MANERKRMRAGITAATRLRHVRAVLDRRLALEILQLDANALHGAHRFFGIAADIALALQHVENALTQLGSRREDTVLARLLAVADAGEHITQGIGDRHLRSEEHKSELQSLMRISYAVFCLKKK